MKDIKFTAFGEEFTVKAKNKLDALGKANRDHLDALCAKNDSWSGSWFGDENKGFRWVEGNFFD